MNAESFVVTPGRARVKWGIPAVLAVIAILTFIGTYSDFLLARVMLSSTPNYTLAVGMTLFIRGEFTREWGVFAAGAVIGALPIVAIFLILQRQLIAAFDGSGRILSVDRDTSGLEADFVLQTEVRDFQARYETPDGAPQIVVNIQAKVARMPQREIAANLNATQQVTAAANDIDSIVVAFNQAAGAAIGQIVSGTLAMAGPAA